MKTSRTLLWLTLLLGLPSVGFTQQGSEIGWVVDTIDSRALGPRAIYVSTPESYGDGVSQYPILVLLDANDTRMFRLWIAQAAYLAGNSPGVPDVIVVGIPNGSDRIHDMIPPATGSSVEDFPNAGGAEAFADFIIDEVVPHVRARYRTLPSVILTGHSAGGLFALDVAARRPSAFQGIIATSPALWYNDGTLVDIYADLLERAPVHPRMFVANASNEGDLAAACERFAELLLAKPSLQGAFAHGIYPDATHSLTPTSFDDGLRFIFDPVSISHLPIEHLDLAEADSVSLQDALHASDSTYAAAARSLGLSERFPEQVLNGLGYDLLDYGKVALAISMFQRNVEAYPQSVNVYDSLGDGFLAAADSASALAQLRNAVEVAHRTGAPVLAETQQKLDRLEASERTSQN